MKFKVISLAVLSILFTGLTLEVRANDDDRVMGRLNQISSKDQMRTSTIYLSIKGNKVFGLPSVSAGTETRFYSKVWDDLYLQITTVTADNGTTGYSMSFSSDEAGAKSLTSTEGKDGQTLLEVDAMDFRTDDNFSARALKSGFGTTTDRGALRMVHFDGFDVETRVLEFNIGDAEQKKKPYFESMSCLLTIHEKTK